MALVKIKKHLQLLILSTPLWSPEQLDCFHQFVIDFYFLDTFHDFIYFFLIGPQNFSSQFQVLLFLNVREESGIDQIIWLFFASAIQIYGSVGGQTEQLSEFFSRLFSICCINHSKVLPLELWELVFVLFQIVVNVVKCNQNSNLFLL